MYYFAYGANMNLKRMNEDCPGARFVGPAVLRDHELIFDGESLRRAGATANIRLKPQSQVWGALFQIGPQELDMLDDYENYPATYHRKEVTVLDPAGIEYPATIAYYREGEPLGKPGESYFYEMLEGALLSGLPHVYTEALEKRVREDGFAT